MHLIERVLGIISDVHAPLSEPASHGTVESAMHFLRATPARTGDVHARRGQAWRLVQ